ncbi:MAG: hypothetical protein JSW24_00615 [Dehalococcoidia bacterium]|nr:MAG: hypothetical protein JSW24_00615 [Dehalococcoidia bacterium]
MKYTKVFRALTLAIIISLLLVAIPATPALAAKEIALEPDEGEIGESFYVKGGGFPVSTCPTSCRQIIVDLYFSSDEADTGDEIDAEVTIYERLKSNVDVGADGQFKKKVEVPSKLTHGSEDEDVHRGTYYVYLTYGGLHDILAFAKFTVINAEIDLDTRAGPVGTKVEIAGIDFADSEEIAIKYDGEDVTDEIVSGYDDETDRYGEFTSAILIPESTAGEHTITVSDETGSQSSAIFTVKPEIAISPMQGVAGNIVEVTGTGFGEEAAVTITFDGEDVATSVTSQWGSFTTGFEVPEVVEGSYNIEVEDEEGNTVEAEFTAYIATEVSINPVITRASPGHVGMNVTVSGIGFEANHEITVTYATEPIVVATAISDAEGAFSATFEVPQSKAGEHIVTAGDGTNTLAATLFMESEAPPIPELLLPEEASRAEAEIYFGWEDVTDPSGVTYTLQIATDEDFTPNSIVLKKEGLTDSGYTINGEEKLEPTKEEAPYYWRVKAIDSASNESGWSTPGSFYIGVGFTWPSWIIHLWWGLGAVAAVFFGLWLGRRAAYRY